jgi:hypothetical protein
MNNQHAELSQVLADQRISERRQQAAHARLMGGAHLSRRRYSLRVPRSWRQPAPWPTIATRHPHGAS